MTVPAHRPTLAQQVRTHALTAQAIGRAATLALHDELTLSPKPGLVTLTSQGSHTDMDAHTFMRSLFALRSYFVRIAELGARGASFEALERCGVEAEARMFAATNGINTHRGAVFMLGLLCAAAGAVAAGGHVAQTSLGAAREFLAAGGARRPVGVARATAIGYRFVQRRLSPGGAADMAAACWMQRIGAPAGST